MYVFNEILRAAIFLMLFTAQYGATVQAQGTVEKPNIVFILTDDMGYGDLGVLYQNKRKENGDRSEPWQFTPNLDQMAAGGATLTNHYAAAPVCAPSRASLLLGVSQGHANVRDNQFDKRLADNHTIPRVLQEAGYATAAIGKWGLQGDTRYSENGDEWPAHPLNRGFDYFLGYIRHVDGHEHYPKEGLYRGTKEVYQNRKNITPKLDKSYTADLWTAGAKQWIIDHQQGENKEDPFFMFLAYDTPHAVLELPTQDYPGGGGLNGGLQWTGKAGQMINTASGKVDSWTHPDYAESTWDHDRDPATPEVDWPAVYKRYATVNRRIDSAVGDLMKLLEDLDIASNTLVVFTSDNGPSRESYLPKKFKPNKPTFFESYGPFDGIKRDTWEGGVRMPTLAMWPDRIPSNSEVDDPSINYDWLATFADAAGLIPPANSDGVSLIPSLTDEGTQQEGLVYIEYFQGGRPTPRYDDFIPERRGRKRGQMQVLRLGNHVGVRYDMQSADDDFEIYDVPEDPGQEHNLAAGPESNPEISALQKQMKERVLQVRMPNETATRPYDEALIPSVEKEEITSGVQWKSYQNSAPWVPSVASLTPADSGYINQPKALVGARENGAIYITGYIRAPKDGEYSFSLTADEGALLRLHEATVIDADYGYESGTPRTGTVQLEAGLHPFHLTYLKSKKDKPLLNLEWSGPGISKQAVSAGVFFRDEGDNDLGR